MKIKLVIWDLDNTLWRGTLAEKEELEIISNRIEIIKNLNSKGIMNSICSKNNFEETKDFLQKKGLWDLFVFPKISFSPKGEIVKQILDEMHLRADNTVFVDDNISNLNEVLYYNPKITVVNEKDCEPLLLDAIKNNKDDVGLKRLAQYRQLEVKTVASKKFSTNDDFLRNSNIKIKFLDVDTEDLIDRLFELSDRTNQLNFTKNRMTRDELANMISDSSIKTKLIHAEDNFGNYGIIGFYSLSNNSLLHFVFSCRIMNMGIEQFVYQYLNYPELKINGEVATTLSSISHIDYITIANNTTSDNNEAIGNYLEKDSEIRILGVGACDLYHPIAYFSMPNQYFEYECNVFVGNERGVNVGTEYLRSQLEMNDSEKDFCKKHFMNYTRHNVFKSAIYNPDWDYIIMSFHDDMVYKIYENKENPNLRVILSPEPKFGLTSVINISENKLDNTELQRQWLQENFKEGVFISPERFLDNLLYISEKVDKKTKIVLITGPELDFFRKEHPTCPEVRSQIKKINKVIRYLGKNYKDKFLVVDINKVIRSKKNITDYIFHLKAKTAHQLFIEIINSIVQNRDIAKEPMIKNLIQGRKVCIIGDNELELLNAYYNLRLGNVNPFGILSLNKKFKLIRHFLKYKLSKHFNVALKISELEKFLKKKGEYYFIIADNNNYETIKTNLLKNKLEPVTDFIQLKEIEYKKVWNDRNE